MWLLAIVAVLFVFYLHHRKKMNYFKKLGIPHIPPLPIIGNMAPIITRSKHRFSVIEELYAIDNEAKYSGFYDFTTAVFVIRDPDVIKNIAVKNFDSFTDHRAMVNENQEPFLGKSLFFLRGGKWRHVRNVLTPAFTSGKLKLMFDLITKCAEDFSNHIALQSGEKISNVVEMKNIFSRYTNDVIASYAFGIETDSIQNPKNQFYTLGKRAVTLDGIFIGKFFIMRAFPALTAWLGITLMPAKLKNFFTDVVKNVISTRMEKGISRPDMIQMLMDYNATNPMELEIDEISAHAFQFYFAGFDNSAVTSAFLAHELAVNPDIQQILQQEIDDVMLASNGKPSFEDINNMSYLDAVFHENLRLHPLVDILDRECTKSFELPPSLPGLKPIVIKPGTNVWLSVAGIQIDSQYYENPNKFDPERFLSKKANTTQSTYLGFGIGPRMCIGNRFAIMQTKLMFFYLLAKCSLKTCSKTTIPLELDPSSLIVNTKGFWLEIQPR